MLMFADGKGLSHRVGQIVQQGHGRILPIFHPVVQNPVGPMKGFLQPLGNGINQVRQLVQALVKASQRPAQVQLEFRRELQGADLVQKIAGTILPKGEFQAHDGVALNPRPLLLQVSPVGPDFFHILPEVCFL